MSDWTITDRPGRIPVLIATVGFFLIFVLSLLVDQGTQSIVRLLAVGALAITIYHGQNWARWLFLVLVILGELFLAYFMLKTPMPPALFGIFLFVGLIHLVFVALLFVPSWGGQYFEPTQSGSNMLDPTDSGPP